MTGPCLFAVLVAALLAVGEGVRLVVRAVRRRRGPQRVRVQLGQHRRRGRRGGTR